MKLLMFIFSVVLFASACSQEPQSSAKSERLRFSIAAQNVSTASVEVVSGLHMSSPEKETVLLQVELSKTDAEVFHKFTKKHVGQIVQFEVDGKAVGDPVIQGEATDGKLVVPFSSRDEAQKVASTLTRK